MVRIKVEMKYIKHVTYNQLVTSVLGRFSRSASADSDERFKHIVLKEGHPAKLR